MLRDTCPRFLWNARRRSGKILTCNKLLFRGTCRTTFVYQSREPRMRYFLERYSPPPLLSSSISPDSRLSFLNANNKSIRVFCFDTILSCFEYFRERKKKREKKLPFVTFDLVTFRRYTRNIRTYVHTYTYKSIYKFLYFRSS